MFNEGEKKSRHNKDRIGRSDRTRKKMSAVRYALGRAGARVLAKGSVGRGKARLSSLTEGNQRIKTAQEHFNKFPNVRGGYVARLCNWVVLGWVRAR